MSTRARDFENLPAYRNFAVPSRECILDVCASFTRLTGKPAVGGVYGYIAILAQQHGRDIERLMKEVYDQSGEYDLLAILRATARGSQPVVPESHKRNRPATGVAPASAEHPAPSSRPPKRRATAPDRRDTPPRKAAMATASPRPRPTPTPIPPSKPSSSPKPTAQPPQTREGSSKPSLVSEWFDGTEDWLVTPPKLDADGHIEGLIYTPDTRPPYDPTSKQRWDRRYWDKRAAERVQVGDLTLAARLAFWELLPPDERILPEPDDAAASGWSS